eukprot:CAMPEP_0118953784 /NCGR_PEP_ID=MMETSP1169-20130426/57167_1 /TAXON_ID=36882 /ORGANISM="Pyramimonas obovata, Strain CCMP722" /LENGTH=236 /DNA_ID=CAMNT_0006901317 /DNA_START=423 /DNA_END=1130 /DNA_ORIENTATION=-
MAPSASMGHHHLRSYQQSRSAACIATAAQAPSPAVAPLAHLRLPTPTASLRLSSAHSAAAPRRAACRHLSSSPCLHRSLRPPPTVRWTGHARDGSIGRPMCAILSNTSGATDSREEREQQATSPPVLRAGAEILEVGVRRQVVRWRGEVVPDVTVKQLALASAALRAQSFYEAPGVDETGVFMLGDCKERAYKRWFLNCCKAEQGRTMQMDTLGMKVVCLVASVPAEALLALAGPD